MISGRIIFSNPDLSRFKKPTDGFIDNISISRTIEKGIYNYIIKLSHEKDIIRKWENPIFRNLYINKS